MKRTRCVCVHFFYISVGFFVFLEWDIQSIAFFSYISRDELSLVLMEHWNNMAMNWTLLEPMLIADVHSVYGSGIAASYLHLCSLFLNWSFGLLCMHRNEFELNRSYFFYSSAIRRHWAHARASPSSLHCCCISDIASGLCAVCVLCAIFFACLCVDVRFLIRESPDCFHARDEVISLFGGIRQHQQQQQQQPILLHLSRSPSRFHIFFA